MAVTIKVEPDLVSTGYNENILVLDSDKKSEDKFELQVDISINGVQTSNIKQSMNTDGYAVFDLHKHLNPYISYDLDPLPGTTFRRIPNSYNKYNIKIKEIYVFKWRFDDNYFVTGGNVGFTSSTIDHIFSTNDRVLIQQDSPYTNSAYNGVHNIVSTPSTKEVEIDVAFGSSSPTEPGTMSYADNRVSIFTATASLTSDKYFYNGVLDWIDVTTQDYTTYLLGTSSVGEFLTSNPTNMEVYLTDRLTMNIYNAASNSNYLEITSDNGTFRIPNSYSFNQHTNKFLSIYVGPYDLINTTDTITVVSGSLPIIDSSTTSYTVKVVDSSYNAVSKTRVFKMIENCTIYEKFQLIYLDRMGAFSAVDFNLLSRNNITVKRDTYQKNHGSYNPDTNSWGYNNEDRGDVVYNQRVDEVYTLNSDWVSDDYSTRIVEMLKSPEVYHLSETGILKSINILTNSFEHKKIINDQLFNYTINFKYSFRNNNQV